MNDASPDGNDMTQEILTQTLLFLDEIRPQVILISGGEFTEHPQFYNFIEQILEFVKNWKIEIHLLLLSNGEFILDEIKTDQIKQLLQLPQIELLQITYDERFYTNAAAIKPHFAEILQLNRKVSISPVPGLLTNLGRAVINHPHLIEPNQKPNCVNLYLMPRQHLPSLRSVIHFLETQTLFNYCKPLVDPLGNLHAGESTNCQIIGTVWDTAESIYNTLLHSRCCNKCGNYDHIQAIARKILES
jgi:hypothetical protein